MAPLTIASRTDRDDYPNDCTWEQVQDKYLESYNTKTFYDVDEEACQLACEEENTFHCFSFDYYKPSQYCYITYGSRYDELLSASTSYNYWERNCRSESRKTGGVSRQHYLHLQGSTSTAMRTRLPCGLDRSLANTWTRTSVTSPASTWNSARELVWEASTSTACLSTLTGGQTLATCRKPTERAVFSRTVTTTITMR